MSVLEVRIREANERIAIQKQKAMDEEAARKAAYYKTLEERLLQHFVQDLGSDLLSDARVLEDRSTNRPVLRLSLGERAVTMEHFDDGTGGRHWCISRQGSGGINLYMSKYDSAASDKLLEAIGSYLLYEEE